MTRRSFIPLALAAATLPMIGCGSSTSQQTVADLTLTLTQAVSSIATLQGKTDLATKIRLDGQVAAQQIAAWKNGSSAQIAVQAINLVVDDLNLVPSTDQYAPLIDVALVTAEYLITLIPISATTTPLVPAASFAAAAPAAHKVKAPNKPTKTPKTSKDFVKQWNAIVAKNPALASAAL